MSKGRQLKRWEVVRFMEEETAGFIVSSGDQNYTWTWQDLKSVFAHDISICSWYEYIEEPKIKTLAERYIEAFYAGESDVVKWLEDQPENKPRIDILEKFESHFMSGERKVRCTERDDVIAEMWEFLKEMK